MPELKPSSFVVPAISALIGGMVGTLLTLSLSRPKPDVRAQPERSTPMEQSEPSHAPLDGRVAALERSLQALSLRDGVARATAKLDAAAADSATKPAADVAPIVDNPVFEAAVRDVMDRAEQERNLEREAQRSEWRKQASEEWANGLSEKLRLTEMQKATALAVATSFWDKLREARQGDAGAPLNRQEWRARLDEQRSAAEAELAKVLSPAQLNSYRELDEASRLGSRRSLRASERGNPAR